MLIMFFMPTVYIPFHMSFCIDIPCTYISVYLPCISYWVYVCSLISMVFRWLRLDLRVPKATLTSPLLYTAVCFQDLCASVVSKSCKASGMLTLWTLIRPDFAFMTFVLVTAFSQLLFRSFVVSVWWFSQVFWWWPLPCFLGCSVALRCPVAAIWPACVLPFGARLWKN